jgi:hypothetical protein
MTKTANHPLCSEQAWSEKVHFTPFVGSEYDWGLVPGVRVLLLGESHYGSESLGPQYGRGCTFYNFHGYIDESCDIDHESQFFCKLPRIVTRNRFTSQKESALAWRRIAFANFVQSLVPAARESPSAAQWRDGQSALTELSDRLRPDVILVLGARLWDHITVGIKCDEPWIKGHRRDRQVWLIPHSNGYARASWIYHPSTNYESLESSIAVISELLRRASTASATPSEATDEIPLRK